MCGIKKESALLARNPRDSSVIPKFQPCDFRVPLPSAAKALAQVLDLSVEGKLRAAMGSCGALRSQCRCLVSVVIVLQPSCSVLRSRRSLPTCEVHASGTPVKAHARCLVSGSRRFPGQAYALCPAESATFETGASLNRRSTCTSDASLTSDAPRGMSMLCMQPGQGLDVFRLAR